MCYLAIRFPVKTEKIIAQNSRREQNQCLCSSLIFRFLFFSSKITILARYSSAMREQIPSILSTNRRLRFSLAVAPIPSNLWMSSSLTISMTADRGMFLPSATRRLYSFSRFVRRLRITCECSRPKIIVKKG